MNVHAPKAKVAKAAATGYPVGPYLSAAAAVLGVGAVRVAARAGLDPACLDDPERPLDITGIAAFFEALALEYGRADFPLRLATGFSRSAFGLPFHLFQCSATVGDGIANLARAKNALFPIAWRVSRDGGGLQLQLEALSPALPVRGATEVMEFVWAVEMARNCTGASFAPARVVVQADAPCLGEAAAILGCPVEIGARGLLRLDAPTAALRLLSANPLLCAVMDPGGSVGQAADPRAAPLTTRVRRDLLDTIAVSRPGLRASAARLGLSPRTLQRRLAAEGTSFHAVLDAVRADLSRHYLERTGLSVKEIAFVLGFAETASFSRAVRGWHGRSPLALRTGRDDDDGEDAQPAA